MGRERPVKLAQGVRIRTYASGRKSIEIQFQYQGVQRKETLSALNPDKKGDRRYAINLKAEVEGAVERQTFHYDEFFPESKQAQLFGHAVSQATIRELIEE
jgi:integrase